MSFFGDKYNIGNPEIFPTMVEIPILKNFSKCITYTPGKIIEMNNVGRQIWQFNM
jgi:hypothetical protein